MELAHSPLGPSSAHRWMNCPGSVAATADAPDRATAHSIEGTAAHTLTEWCRQHDRRAEEYLGQTITINRDGTAYGILVDQGMVDACQEFVDYVNDRLGDALIEERVTYEEYVPGGFGTLDDGRLAPGVAYITDFKYGQGVPVDAKGNEQLLLYALGAWLRYGWLYGFEKFVLAVYQPRLGHVTEWEVTTEWLLSWARNTLRPAVRALKAEAPEFRAGDWCRWCRVKDVCKTRAEAIFDTVVGEFDDLDTAIPRAGKVRQPGTLTNDQIAKILEALPEIQRWCKDIEVKAMAEIGHGHAVGDWKIVEGRGGRDWGPEEDALQKAWNAAGLDPLGLYEKKLLSPAKAEKLVGKKHPLWATEGLVVKVRGKPTLAPGSDKRSPMTVDANIEFENLEGTAD